MSMHSSSPAPIPAPGRSVSSPTPVSDSSALMSVTAPGSLRAATASSRGTRTTEVFSKNDAVLVEVCRSPKSSLVSTAKNATPIAAPRIRSPFPAARSLRQKSASSSMLAVENRSAMSVNGPMSANPSLLSSSEVLRVIITAASSNSPVRRVSFSFTVVPPNKCKRVQAAERPHSLDKSIPLLIYLSKSKLSHTKLDY